MFPFRKPCFFKCLNSLLSFQVTSVLAALFVLNSVSAQCLTGNDNPPTMNAKSREGVTNSRFNFALDTLKKTVQIEPSENIFYSPHSLHQALTLAYFGARGTTEESLRKALHIPIDLSKVDVQRYYAFENSVKQASQVRRLRVASLSFELTSVPRQSTRSRYLAGCPTA